MRMWVIHPELLCRKHLIGQHVEMHMFLGSIKKGTSMKGFIKNNLLQPKGIKTLHDETVKEMIKRGYNHKSPITEEEFNKCFNMLSEEYQNHKIDIRLNYYDLLKRCSECKKNIETYNKEHNINMDSYFYFVYERD